MRRRSILLPFVLLAGALLARRRRRARAAHAPLAAPPKVAAAVLPEPPPRFVSVPWTLTAAPESRSELTLRYACPGHMQLDRIDARETPSQVFVTVLLSRQPPMADGLAPLQEHEAVIALSGPLGTRALVHAPVDVAAPGDGPAGPSLYP